MDHDAVLTLFDQQIRQSVQGDTPGTLVERTGGVIRHAGADAWSGIVWSDLDEGSADAEIAAQVRWFADADSGDEFEWKVYSHDRPADLGERLRTAGFTPEPEETLMIAKISELPADTGLPEGVRLRPVTDVAGVDLAMDVHEKAFGNDGSRLRRRLLAQLEQSPDTISLIVAMAGDLPVSVARMELNPGTAFAGLWGGGTVPGWRGRGIYRALVAHRAGVAAGLGYDYLQVDASDQSRPILQRLGFAALSTTTPYLYTYR